MPKDTARLPPRITLFWGRDRLQIDDPIWIAKIVGEIDKRGQKVENGQIRLSDPRSRTQEQIDAHLGIRHRQQDLSKQIGYQAPTDQPPVAAELLKEFLGLEMPIALSFLGDSGRSEHRMSAVHADLETVWPYDGMPDELRVCWSFSGYQLYANHHIGTALHRPLPTWHRGQIERRQLDGKWLRVGFDGASQLPDGRKWSRHTRTFILSPDGVDRLDEAYSDLMPLYDDDDDDDDSEVAQTPECI